MVSQAEIRLCSLFFLFNSHEIQVIIPHYYFIKSAVYYFTSTEIFLLLILCSINKSRKLIILDKKDLSTVLTYVSLTYVSPCMGVTRINQHILFIK